MTQHHTNSRRNTQHGSSLLEFALFSIFLVPLFMGTITAGVSLGKSIQVSQVARDSGQVILAEEDGTIAEVDANYIKIKHLTNISNCII